ncbi:MAG: hypothetical protein U5L72_13505 [Bacteroidales bacterium]|nr:hypothetical protein [Bacteroidales bacterium]
MGREKAAMALRDAFKKYPAISHLGDEVMEAYHKSGIEGIFKWLIDVNMTRPVPVWTYRASLFHSMVADNSREEGAGTHMA